MSMITVGGNGIHYEIQGQGPPLLFIHGIGADLRNPIRIFDSPLHKRFTVLAFDPRGLGESESECLPASLAEMADDAAGLAESVGWTRYHLFGASMGGMVAQELAIRYPDAVDRLVLGVTHAGGSAAGTPVIDKLETMTTVQKLQLSDTRQDEAWAAAHPEAIRRAEAQAKAAREVMRNNPTLARGYANQMQAVLRHDTADRLHRIAAPTLVFGGRYDGSCPPAVSRMLADGIHGARYELVDAGHGNWFFDNEVWDIIIHFLGE